MGYFSVLYFLCLVILYYVLCFFFQAEDGIRDKLVTGVQTCALPISKFYNDSNEIIKAHIYLLNENNAIPKHNQLFKFSIGGNNWEALDYVYQAIEKAKQL